MRRLSHRRSLVIIFALCLLVTISAASMVASAESISVMGGPPSSQGPQRPPASPWSGSQGSEASKRLQSAAAIIGSSKPVLLTQWRCQSSEIVGSNGSIISRTHYNDSDWYHAGNGSTVLAALLAAGEYGGNNQIFKGINMSLVSKIIQRHASDITALAHDLLLHCLLPKPYYNPHKIISTTYEQFGPRSVR